MESITIPVPPERDGVKRRVTVQWHVEYQEFIDLAKQHGKSLEDIRNFPATARPSNGFCTMDLEIDGVRVIVFGHAAEGEDIVAEIGRVAA